MENRTAEIAQTFGAPADGAAGLLSLHQYELLFEMTTQLLAAQSLDEQTSLVLDTLTAWLARDDEAAADFLRQVGAPADLFALPLFGAHVTAAEARPAGADTGPLR